MFSTKSLDGFLQVLSGPFRFLQVSPGSFKFLTESWEHRKTPWPSCNVLFLLILLREPLPDTNQELHSPSFVCVTFSAIVRIPFCRTTLLAKQSTQLFDPFFLLYPFDSFLAKGSIVKKKHWKCPLRLLLLLAFWDVNFIHGNVFFYSSVLWDTYVGT